MKVTLDITKLLQEEKISKEEYNKLKKLSSTETQSLAANALVAFGVIAVTAGGIAFHPTTYLILIFSMLLITIGSAISYQFQKQWGILGTILLLIGALGIGYSLLELTSGGTLIFLLISLLFLLVSIGTKSSLMTILSVLAIAPAIQIGTTYRHASYTLFVEQPILTIVIYGGLGFVAYLLSKSLKAPYERLGIIYSRVCLFMVNFGFWVGSLWGDRLLPINDLVLSVLWALFLIIMGVWAAAANRRFYVNTVATFAGIHFYTQWFERLGAEPLSILIAGIIAIIFSVALWKYN